MTKAEKLILGVHDAFCRNNRNTPNIIRMNPFYLEKVKHEIINEELINSDTYGLPANLDYINKVRDSHSGGELFGMKIVEDRYIVDFKIEYKEECQMKEKEITAESKITIKIGEVSVELTQTEADQLYNSLGTVLGKNTYITYPIYIPCEPIPCTPTWTTCSSDLVGYDSSTTIVINNNTAS